MAFWVLEVEVLTRPAEDAYSSLLSLTQPAQSHLASQLSSLHCGMSYNDVISKEMPLSIGPFP